MCFNELKSPKDRVAIASEAAESMSFVREMEKTGIPFDFWAISLTHAAPVEAKAKGKKGFQNIFEWEREFELVKY